MLSASQNNCVDHELILINEVSLIIIAYCKVKNFFSLTFFERLFALIWQVSFRTALDPLFILGSPAQGIFAV
jgi:hypothetical protein